MREIFAHCLGSGQRSVPIWCTVLLRALFSAGAFLTFLSHSVASAVCASLASIQMSTLVYQDVSHPEHLICTLLLSLQLTVQDLVLVQHKEWYTLMADVCSMQLLWHLGTNVIPAFQVLERFEHRSFIHVSTKNTSRGSHSEARQPSSLVLFNLPRFRLTFELHPGSSTLVCSNYSGYSIPVIDASELQHQRSAVTLPLMRF